MSSREVRKTVSASAPAIGDDDIMNANELVKMMPDELRPAHAEALHRCPELLRQESPVEWFLFGPPQHRLFRAAMGLVLYWKRRKDIFGELAFASMERIGETLLSEEGVALRSGYLALLPPDAKGSSVLCLDWNRLPASTSLSSESLLLQQAFWILQWILSQPENRRTGLVVLVHGSSITGDGRGRVDAIIDLLQALPIQIKQVVVVASDSEQTYGVEWDTIPTSVLSGQVADQVRQQLEAFGLNRQGLPASLGGSWRYDSFTEWLSRRTPTLSSQASTSAKDDRSLKPPARTSGEQTHAVKPRTTAKELFVLEEAIQALPSEDKRELLEAREIIPDLAEKEAPMSAFWHFEGDADKAARRLALYWKTRKQVYGERAFLPLTSSGEGALNRDEVLCFTSGYIVLLPYDTAGRSVLCCDPSRSTDRKHETRLRLAFYVLSILAENPKSITDGCQCLVVMRSKSDDTVSADCVNLLNALPVKCHALHLVSRPQELNQCQFLGSSVPFFTKLIGPELRDKILVHAAKSSEAILSKLSEHELSKDCIPECLGGAWSYDQFLHWVELRTRFEWELPPVGPRGIHVPHVPEYQVPARAELNEEEKTERKRRLNVLNSRRKRERSRVEVAVFHDQAADLRKSNQDLRKENKRLSDMLETAKAKVARIEMPTPNNASGASSSSALPERDQILPQGALSSPFSLASLPNISNQQLRREQVLQGRGVASLPNLGVSDFELAMLRQRMLLQQARASSLEQAELSFLLGAAVSSSPSHASMPQFLGDLGNRAVASAAVAEEGRLLSRLESQLRSLQRDQAHASNESKQEAKSGDESPDHYLHHRHQR